MSYAFEPASFRLQPGESHTLPDGTRFVRTAPILGSGTKVWCNVEYDPDGRCLGADGHWLSPRPGPGLPHSPQGQPGRAHPKAS